jgi:hypothetical protein
MVLIWLDAKKKSKKNESKYQSQGWKQELILGQKRVQKASFKERKMEKKIKKEVKLRKE